MTLKLLVFGRTGQVGAALANHASPGIHVTALGRETADLNDPAICAQIVATTDADVVVNAAAYTAVDTAEEDEMTAMAVNARAPGAMADATRRRQIPFIHLSTDYVFSGGGFEPWTERDLPAPINVYGATKRVGEQAVLGANPDSLILRTSWVFSTGGSNFVRAMLSAARRRGHLAVVDDQIGCPTPAETIAETILRLAPILTQGLARPGIFHYCGAPAVTWLGFAEQIFTASKVKSPKLTGIASADWPTPAARPNYSVLDCGRIQRTYGIEQPDWRAALGQVVSHLTAQAA